MTRFGMLVEFHCNGVSTFMLAEVSNTDAEDVRAMYLEQEISPADAQELYDKLPVIKPMDPVGILRPAREKEVVVPKVDYSQISKIVDVATLQSMPKCNWDQIFVLVGKK